MSLSKLVQHSWLQLIQMLLNVGYLIVDDYSTIKFLRSCRRQLETRAKRIQSQASFSPNCLPRALERGRDAPGKTVWANKSTIDKLQTKLSSQSFTKTSRMPWGRQFCQKCLEQSSFLQKFLEFRSFRQNSCPQGITRASEILWGRQLRLKFVEYRS